MRLNGLCLRLRTGFCALSICAAMGRAWAQPPPPPIPEVPAHGKIVFNANRNGNGEIHVINPDGTDETNLNLTPFRAHDQYPSWSPDGSQIVFASGRSGGVYLYKMNADGTQPTTLTDDDKRGSYPAWSPDGQRIAFSGVSGPPSYNNWDIYVISSDGSGEVRLTTDPAVDTHPTWSPDSRQIAFESCRDGLPEIYVMNADGSRQTRLTLHGGRFPAWSPDGRKIAFTGPRNHIWVMNFDGTHPEEVTHDATQDRSPAWSPDGLQLVFESVSEFDGSDGKGTSWWSRHLFIVNMDGSHEYQLTRSHGVDNSSPSWIGPSNPSK